MKMMTVKDVQKIDCTGCGACAAICPKKAITFCWDNEGFRYPEIDMAKCISCGKCYRECPTVDPPEGNNPLNYKAVCLKDKKKLMESSSGGCFFGLAEYIVERKGYVVGCVLDKNMLPIHIITQDINDVERMRGSKYVQSYIDENLYKKIESVLKAGHEVLFTGTPCQASGLKKFLNREYDNLYVVDVICHGVGSPGIYLNYIKGFELKQGQPVKNVKFRCRDVAPHPNNRSMHIEIGDKVYCKYSLKDKYGAAFFYSKILRESCYRCLYAKKNRVSDLTIGDYFEPNENLKAEFRNGSNIVLVCTQKGNRLFEKAEHLFFVEDVSEQKQRNLEKPTHRPKDRDRLKKASFDFENVFVCVGGGTGYTLRITLSDKIRLYMPKGLKEKIKKLLKW